MPYTINRTALDRFVARQVDLVEATPLPDDIRHVVPAADELGPDELHAIWLGAGLATQVGLALLETPGRFVTLTIG
jgi:hypothetical protein